MERNENVYTRIYQRLDAVFANTSAFLSIIYQIFSLINTFIYYKKLNLDLIDPFFNFNEEKQSLINLKICHVSNKHFLCYTD